MAQLQYRFRGTHSRLELEHVAHVHEEADLIGHARSADRGRNTMLTEKWTHHVDVLGIGCDRKRSKDNLKRMRALLHARLDVEPIPGLAVDLSAFHGDEGLAALIEDLEIDTK